MLLKNQRAKYLNFFVKAILLNAVRTLPLHITKHMQPLNRYPLKHSHQPIASEGFTLIELLVVIIIVGVLSTIALPSYLSQASKVRGAEAKSILGSINRAQQAYRLENATMASSYTVLGTQNNAKFYSYEVAAIDANNATASTTTQNAGLRSYSARIQHNNDTFQQIICESINTMTQGTIADLPVNISSCFVNYNVVD